jgi:hypothetical protein
VCEPIRPWACSFAKYTHTRTRTNTHIYIRCIFTEGTDYTHTQYYTKYGFFYASVSFLPPSQLHNIASDFNPRLKYACSVRLQIVPYLSELSTFIFITTVYTKSIQETITLKESAKTTKSTEPEESNESYFIQLATRQCEIERKITGGGGGGRLASR